MKLGAKEASRCSGVLAFAVLTLAGCGLPQQMIQLAEETDGQITQRTRELETSRQELLAFQESEESVGYRGDIEREQWLGQLSTAEAVVSQARKLYDERVKPVIEADDSSRENDAYQALLEIPKLLDSARDSAGFWRARRELLTQAKQNADALLKTARVENQQIQNTVQGLQSRFAAAKREFPEQSEGLDRAWTSFQSVSGGAKDSLSRLEAQERTRQAQGVADYGVVATESEKIRSSLEQITQGAATAEARIAELSRSYAKTLIDMRADYALVIRRQSWDNSAEYPSLHDYDYPEVTVDGGTFDYFDSIPTSLATFSKGWFGNDLTLLAGVDRQRWDSLKIDPEQAWPSSDDDAAELWLQTATAKYFHKYHVVENGEPSETDWVPVEEAFFFANIDNLGMDVEAKPYGLFEAQKLTHAAPPGMAYVGNPRYGRWERQGGGTVWTWIAPYLFYRSLFGTPWNYRRDEWNTWHTGYYGSRPYYGGTSSAPAYGTRSSRTQTSPTLSGSNFGRSGGFNRPAGSVRGAGPASRGGGFGGSGK